MSALVYVSTARGDDATGDGTAARPVLSYGRALDLSREGDEIVVDGMVGNVPERRQHHRNRSALGAFWAFVTLGTVLMLVVVGVMVVQAFMLWWHHPVAGALICGGAAIVGYVVYCKRHGIAL